MDTRIPMLMQIELEHIYSRVPDPFTTPKELYDLERKNAEHTLTSEEADMETHKLFSRYFDYDKIYDNIEEIESSSGNKIHELYDKQAHYKLKVNNSLESKNGVYKKHNCLTPEPIS